MYCQRFFFCASWYHIMFSIMQGIIKNCAIHYSAQILLGLQITSSDDVFVGESASLTCSSDLDVTTIEWFLDGQVVLSNTGQQELELTFNPVPDTIHNSEYSCRVTSPYGTQEASHRVTAEGRVVITCTMIIVFKNSNVVCNCEGCF